MVASGKPIPQSADAWQPLSDAAPGDSPRWGPWSVTDVHGCRGKKSPWAKNKKKKMMVTIDWVLTRMCVDAARDSQL